MNYNYFHAITARAEATYTAAQDFIANECPLLEQRLKTAALSTAVNVLTITLSAIDWASAQLSKSDEYAIRLKLAYVNAKRFAVRQLIKIVRVNQQFQITAKVAKFWSRKGVIAQSALDKVFCLEG